MKPKQLVTLLITLGILAAAALVLRTRQDSRTGDRGSSSAYRELVFPDLDIGAITAVTITDSGGSVHISRTDAGWTLVERDGYAADFGKLSDLVQGIGRLKIAQGMPIPDSALGRVGLLDPGTTEATPGTTATRIDLLGASNDQPLATLLIGKSPSSGGSDFGSGKIVRAATDSGMAWIVNENFTAISADPKEWVSKDFFEVDGLRSINLSAPNPADSWSAARSGEESDFIVAEPGPGMETDASKVSSFKYLLGSPSFQDLLDKQEAAAVDFSRNTYRAKLETFDGFTYHLDMLAEMGEPAAEGQEPRATSYLVKLSVSGSFKETRDPVEDETEEAAQAADKAFAEQLELRREKLAAEQKLQGHVYRVSEYALTALIRKKSDLVMVAAEPETSPAASGAPPASPPALLQRPPVPETSAPQAPETTGAADATVPTPTPAIDPASSPPATTVPQAQEPEVTIQGTAEAAETPPADPGSETAEENAAATTESAAP